ncbi:MAG: phenylalanine--tRNA ligase subunit beta [Acidimicrobiia bacterium]|nr:phenylalanine--tRNA ligase subunit beta [Acidimicrobiia bacterium]
MRVPLSWLTDFVALDAEPRAIAEALDRLGLEVEALDAPGEEITGVKVARILEVRPHPNADKLQLCDIEFGDGTTTVVCGAPNVVNGMVVAYAPSGATLPGGFKLERRKIRGEVSDGMLCSSRELGLGEEHDGILPLASDAELGMDVRDLLGLHDVVFDLSVTPNRSDAMSIVGVARDLAAHFGVPLTVAEPTVDVSGDASDISVLVEAVERAPRFTARQVGVTMGPSPDWMQRRLTLAGMRPISNVVDVTNYVMLERGQPSHAFDLDRLRGPGLVVRTAQVGETLTTLDDVERKLVPSDLLICDADRRPQAIAGIMGGAEAEVHDGTTGIVLEVAYFAPMGISMTSKRLGLRSEASARFERGVDPNGVMRASDRVVELLAEVAGAPIGPPAIDEYPTVVARERIRVRPGRVGAVLGVELDGAQVRESLRPLGIDIEEIDGDAEAFTAIAPTYRPDLVREIDVVEEVGRRIGLDSIPRTLPHTTEQGGGLTARQRARRLVADVMVGLGHSEAMTLPLIAEADLSRIGVDPAATVRATNALSAEEPVLRPAILPGLLKSVAHNAGLGLSDVALFELGHVFGVPPKGQLLPDERDHLAFVASGTMRRGPVEPDRPVDVYDATDALHAIVDALQLTGVETTTADHSGYLRGRAASVVVGGVTIGAVGELDPAVLASFGALAPAVAFEVDLDPLLAGDRRDQAFAPLSRYPAAAMDLAFVLDESVPAAAVVATIRKAGGELLEDARVFDEFRSEALGVGRRSLAVALRFRAPDRTLKDTELNAVWQACIDAVVKHHRAELRS